MTVFNGMLVEHRADLLLLTEVSCCDFYAFHESQLSIFSANPSTRQAAQRPARYVSNYYLFE